MGFVVDKVALGQVSPPEYFGFPLSVSFHGAPLHGKTKQINHLYHRLHNKPQGCGASAASAAGTFTKKRLCFIFMCSKIILILQLVDCPIPNSKSGV
jgi:hypothetical protein